MNAHSQNADTGFLSNSLMMMVMMSTVIPVITTSINELIKQIIAIVPVIWDRLKKIIGPKYYSVTIQRTLTYVEKFGLWTADADQKGNGYLVEAVLEFMANNKIYSDDTDCNLGTGKNDICNTNEYMRSRIIEYLPSTEVNYEDFYISYSVSVNSNGTERKEKTIKLQISSKKSVQCIEKFLRDRYEEYLEVHYDDEDKHQYLYKQIPSAEGLRFKKYPINNRATFDKLYFPEKSKIIGMADKLMAGDLAKLSIMLTGVPGCGKSSVIKALARKLGYHIIEVKLSFITSDASMTDIFHNKSIMYFRNNDEKFQLDTDHVPLDKRVYIFEDVDAECDVIHNRADGNMYTDNTHDDTCDTDEKKDKKRGEDITAEILYKSMMKKYLKRGLTLSGVLNTLDGVLEINGSVIVMTTNHPEKLDPAFYRPGRINMKIELGKMSSCDGDKLVESYFGEPAGNIRDGVFTPATLEAFCQSANTIEELRAMISEYVPIQIG